jgi:hypothetical protein
MRPLLSSLPPPTTLRDADVLVALVRVRGRLCAVCERPLFTRGFVWDPIERLMHAPPFPPAADVEDLERLLVVCDDCWSAYISAGQPDNVPLPTEAPPVPMVFLRDGTVLPLDGGAEVLVGTFRLNGADGFDLRPTLRRAAFAEAQALAQEFAGADAANCRRLRRRIWAYGFVSTWAQALDGDLRDLAFSAVWDETFPNPAPGSPPEWYHGTADFARTHPAVFR